VEAGESKLDALRREVLEELGAIVDIGEAIPVGDPATTVYRCTLISLDPALRCGPEFEDETRGAYIERRISPEELRSSPSPLFPVDILEHL
jgi:8-oxo-dGTP pyrophosphatase MutT (NUDIX family)